MPSNNKPTRTEKWRENIKASMLVNRLKQHAYGEVELTTSQIKAIEIILRKTIPDLKAIEHYGKDGGAIEFKSTSENDKAIIDQFVNNRKGVKSEL